jgi:hypothetical protein
MKINQIDFDNVECLKLLPDIMDTLSLEEQKCVVRTLAYTKHMSRANMQVVLGKGDNWIYARINDKYSPRGARTEAVFQKDVEVNLITQHHTIISRNLIVNGLESDIRSEKDNILYITEVKVSLENQQLFTGLGQLLAHQSVERYEKGNHNKAIYQLGIPIEYRNDYRYISKAQLKRMKELEIELLYVQHSLRDYIIKKPALWDEGFEDIYERIA